MKHEIRSSKFETNSKHEIQSTKLAQKCTFLNFRFSFSCLFRASNFGFRAFLIAAFVVTPFLTTSAQTPAEYSDPTSSSFRIVVCDGPTLPPSLMAEATKGGKRYQPCDFKGLMLQVQHLINIMMVLGVFASIGAFSWAGWLYISGVPANKSKAHAIFPKIFTGFIIMLSSWFIVYQILSWLTDNSGFKVLLGTP